MERQENSAPSIPSRFKAPSKSGHKAPKAFGNSCSRFKDSTKETPGPGSYYKPIKYILSSKECGSISKKGYGVGFVSKTSRFEDSPPVEDLTPGPGMYSAQKVEKKSFSRFKHSSTFIKPKRFRDEPLQPSHEVPAPGQYEQRIDLVPKYKQKMKSSSFGSKSTRRHLNANDKQAPGPGSYFNPIDYSREKNKGAVAAFRSTSRRSELSRENVKTPGPGAYIVESNAQSDSNDDHVRLLHSPRQCLVQKKKAKQLSSMFANNGLDRFGRPYEKKSLEEQMPGPGSYDPTPARPISSASAMSSFLSSGKKGFGSGWAPPGPAYYNPSGHVQDKRSFLLNAKGSWV